MFFQTKKEALDVVEEKITSVLNNVRVGDEFQNPILRLGKTGNSYAKVLSRSSINVIKQHYNAAKKNLPSWRKDSKKRTKELYETNE